jgi:hypothetical protein
MLVGVKFYPTTTKNDGCGKVIAEPNTTKCERKMMFCVIRKE